MNLDPAQKVLQCGAAPLSRIMNLNEAPSADWRMQDVQAMLRHQLAAPLAFDLGNAAVAEDQAGERNRALGEAKKLGIISFQDLFTHRTPPVVLLKLVKDLFKGRSGASSQRRPEHQVAYVLYLLTILSARVRCGQSITRLTDTEVSRSVQWATSLEWVDAVTKALLAEAKANLG